MTKQEEEYIHFVNCIGNLNETWRILHNIKENIKNSLVGPAFQFALIEYSKPYLKSHGIETRSHSLGTDCIPPKYHKLHHEIIAARNQIHAHTDLTVEDARVYVANADHGKIVGVIKNKIYDNKLGKIDDIINMIEKTLDCMYEKVKQLESELPVHSLY